jgi:hypothetical protein
MPEMDHRLRKAGTTTSSPPNSSGTSSTSSTDTGNDTVYASEAKELTDVVNAYNEADIRVGDAIRRLNDLESDVRVAAKCLETLSTR